MKATLSSLAILAALSASPASGQSVAEARTAFRAGEFEVAIDEYRDVVASDPAAAQARMGLMEALVATGEYDEAVEFGQSEIEAWSEFGTQSLGQAGDQVEIINAVLVDGLVKLCCPKRRLELCRELVACDVEKRRMATSCLSR